MLETDKSIFVIITLAIAISCVAGALVFYDDTESYSISYEVDGGTLGDNSPTKYTPGQYLKIPTPDKEDCVFNGWYLDSACTTLFNGYTIDMTGDITLYAQWSDNLSGHTVTLTKSGYFDRGLSSYEISGDLTFTYLYYNDDKGSYFIRNSDNTTYTYKYIGNRDYSESTSSTYWSSEIEGTWTELGNETITLTINGVETQKECEVVRLTYANGATETQWIGDGWIPYQIVYYYGISSWVEKYEMKIVYTYQSDGIVTIPSDCEITVIEGNGVDVSGNNGPYKLGESVTLTAKVSDGFTFSGWYDENFTLLSNNETYKFVVGGSQTIYAMNTKTVDIEFASDTEVSLNIEGNLINATYTITNIDTMDTVTSADDRYIFQDGGSYRIVGNDSNGATIFYNAKVTGDVKRTFDWTYDNNDYSISIEIDYDDLLYTRDYYSVKERAQQNSHTRDKTFVTLSYENETMAPYMTELVGLLTTELNKNYKTVSETTLLGYLLAFTQYIEYQTDEEYMGTEEYWKFPLETLYDQGGDCEDTSILFIALAHQCRSEYGMSYDVALQLLPGHMAGAVKLNSGSGKYTTNPSGYIYAETTTIGYYLGEIPSTMSSYFTNSRYYSNGYSATVEID